MCVTMEARTKEKEMKSFLVTWEINIDADTAEEAALDAWQMYFSEDTDANFFTVEDEETGKKHDVDVDDLLWGGDEED